ncbi:MAG: hypothetical protein F9K15_24260 [Zoogloea sp.]|nr:MAG: hypothetical protein F9K15_24260 [Zoogloea sp.]
MNIKSSVAVLTLGSSLSTIPLQHARVAHLIRPSRSRPTSDRCWGFDYPKQIEVLYIKGCHNSQRKHSALGYRSPKRFEEHMLEG